jgi:hypothetical protein
LDRGPFDLHKLLLGVTIMRALALVVTVVLFLVSSPVLACSVCGCDPTGGNLSLDRPTESELRFSVEDRYLAKESGAGDEHEGEKEDRINLRFQYSPPIPRLSFQLDVPLYAWKAHYGADTLQDDTTQGLSDISLTARYELLHLDGFRHVFALLGGIKAPTGANNHLAPVDGDTIDEHKQIGTGTWDETVGLSYTFGDFPTVAYASVAARFNGTNARQNHYGNAFFGVVGVRRTILESKRLYFAIDAQGRNAGKDTTPDLVYDENSGGFVGYGVGTVGFAFTNNLLARFVLQVPVVKQLNGVQDEHPVYFLALAYDLPMGPR